MIMKRTFLKCLLFAGLALTVFTASCEKDNDNDNGNWVDLGLPSGLLWAKCNLGATAPEEYGDYIAWGETQGKDFYKWITYRHCTVDADSNLASLTKYNTSTDLGTVDGLTTLESVDDAAAVRLGNGARTPTKEEWQELLDNTTAEWTTINDVNGCKFTGPNGNSLFLPAAGAIYRSRASLDGRNGIYWSSSLRSDTPSEAFGFRIISDMQLIGYGDRYCGFSVRAVKRK